MSDEFSPRLEKLESHIAHLEHHVEQLNEVVIEQGNVLLENPDGFNHSAQRWSVATTLGGSPKIFSTPTGLHHPKIAATLSGLITVSDPHPG